MPKPQAKQKPVNPQVNLRLEPSDMVLLQTVAKNERRSVTDVVRWGARLYAMVLLCQQHTELPGQASDLLEQTLGPEAEELRVQFARDERMFRQFFESVKRASTDTKENTSLTN